MKIDILTLFPEMFNGPFDQSIIKRAVERKIVKINVHQLRDWANDKRKTVDDRPYGGGNGMILKVEPIYKAVKKLKKKSSKVILLSPKGRTFNQEIARDLSFEKNLIFICGHYEEFDERIRENLIDDELSIGDYVLTGGELPAMVITDSIVRLLPGVLEKENVTEFESFSLPSEESGVLLEYPQYTHPENFKGWKVPKILLSGNHKEIEEWRMKKAAELTKKQRPDL